MHKPDLQQEVIPIGEGKTVGGSIIKTYNKYNVVLMLNYGTSKARGPDEIFEIFIFFSIDS